MQKRERDQSKQGGAVGGSAPPTAKRGRPIGSGSNSAVAAAVTASIAGASDSASPSTLFGPSLQVYSAFAEQNNKRIVMALQSGLKSELTWAFNALTLLSFKEKDEVRRDSTPLAKIPGLLDALLQIIDDWRDIALPRVLTKAPRVRLLGNNSVATGFGNEYESLTSSDTLHPNGGSGFANKEVSVVQKTAARPRPSGWWFEEDGLFNLDEEGRAEKQQCAVAASNIIRNFSFMAENEIAMGQNRHCLETMFQCLEDYITEDEELVTNCLETIMNLGPLIDLRTFSSSKPSYIKITEKRVVQAIMGILGSAVRSWHCAAADLLGRLILNPDNEPFLLPFVPQMFKRLIDIMSYPAGDVQAAAIGALYNLVEVNMDCRLKLASERWLLKVIKAPHPVPEVCRKAALILENLVSEPQNKPLLLAYENVFADMLFSDTRYADTFARILHELTSRPGNKVASARGIWGM
ncbi:armadillo repeat-containing protein LFR-like isoform X2 [Andrographis paniculata]|uniref:armadillo repeat-containing protein LFR-like isoform X2 n=1 Tax=Andrographis paniculata TaxID=175694 RepID=UPI0021E71DCE|nr:armadillo repeat-containing protein LFR-like isoform X2 [Andrographis paniculata]